MMFLKNIAVLAALAGTALGAQELNVTIDGTIFTASRVSKNDTHIVFVKQVLHVTCEERDLGDFKWDHKLSLWVCGEDAFRLKKDGSYVFTTTDGTILTSLGPDADGHIDFDTRPLHLVLKVTRKGFTFGNFRWDHSHRKWLRPVARGCVIDEWVRYRGDGAYEYHHDYNGNMVSGSKPDVAGNINFDIPSALHVTRDGVVLGDFAWDHSKKKWVLDSTTWVCVQTDGYVFWYHGNPWICTPSKPDRDYSIAFHTRPFLKVTCQGDFRGSFKWVHSQSSWVLFDVGMLNEEECVREKGGLYEFTCYGDTWTTPSGPDVHGEIEFSSRRRLLTKLRREIREDRRRRQRLARP